MKIKKLIITFNHTCPFYEYQEDCNGPDIYYCHLKMADTDGDYKCDSNNCILKKADYLIHLKQTRKIK